MYKLDLSTEDPLINIKDGYSRIPEADEKETLLNALRSLLAFARDERGYKGHIETPDEWRIIDNIGYKCGYALGKFGVLYNLAFEQYSSYLPAILAHIIGWYNYPDKSKENQPAYEMLFERDNAASFTYETLPHYLKEGLVKVNRPGWKDSLFRRKKLTTPSLPEVLRPKPVDVLIGGGYNYHEFSYSREEEETDPGTNLKVIYAPHRDSDSAQGKMAVTKYLKALDLVEWEDFEERVKILFMQESFQYRDHTAKRFRKAQRYADYYAVFMFGQGGQLLDLLTRHRQLSTTDTEQTVHFYQPLAVRIEYLKELLAT